MFSMPMIHKHTQVVVIIQSRTYTGCTYLLLYLIDRINHIAVIYLFFINFSTSYIEVLQATMIKKQGFFLV